MHYVLDTCTFLWLATDQTRLSPVATTALADVGNMLHLSVISVTETHRLIRKGKIVLQTNLSLDAWFRAMLIQHQVQDEPITSEIAHGAEVLPSIHNDPADRFILATAQILGARILSPDNTMPKYPGFAVEW
jgi:PIN domain nuclease of toxin-antitoxin system